MWAIAEKHAGVVRLLVERGADVALAADSGFTPFLFAARTGDIDIAKFLLSKGATIKDTAKDGTSALHVAVVRGHIPFARFLLDLGADPNADGPGFTPLHWAVGTWESVFTHDYVFAPEASTLEYQWMVLGGIPDRDVKISFVKRLLEMGANVNAPIKRPPPRYGASIFPSNYLIGGTAFHIAASVADVPLMRLLLAAGADPNRGAADRTTPLMVAAGLARVDSETLIPEAKLLEAVQLCLDLGQDINAANNAGNTAMHAAALQGLDGMTQFLFDHGAQVNAKNKKGETPTRIADGYEFASMLYTRPSTAALLRKLGGTH
jgi:ankyrin repeat protein